MAFHQQQAKVEAVQQKIIDLEDALFSARNELYKEAPILEGMCEKSAMGHVYVAEHNGDCHSSGYYYTCQTCKHFTMMRPNTYVYK